MKITHKTESDLVIVKPEGRIDAAALGSFSAYMNTLIQKGHKKILIDFSQTEYLSSSGIRALVQVKQDLEAKKGTVALCSPNPHLKELFSVVQLDKMFSIYPSDFDAYDELLD